MKFETWKPKIGNLVVKNNFILQKVLISFFSTNYTINVLQELLLN